MTAQSALVGPGAGFCGKGGWVNRRIQVKRGVNGEAYGGRALEKVVGCAGVQPAEAAVGLGAVLAALDVGGHGLEVGGVGEAALVDVVDGRGKSGGSIGRDLGGAEGELAAEGLDGDAALPEAAGGGSESNEDGESKRQLHCEGGRRIGQRLRVDELGCWWRCWWSFVQRRELRASSLAPEKKGENTEFILRGRPRESFPSLHDDELTLHCNKP